MSDPAPAIELDPMALVLHASGPVAAVLWLLVAASVATWVIIVLKLRQLRRWERQAQGLIAATRSATSLSELELAARRYPASPDAAVLKALWDRRAQPDVLEVVGERACTEQRHRGGRMLGPLASVGAASPFIGLLGTVYGIMDAFLRIGREKSATLPVVAPAIGEALIATAIGLFAAIPAVIAFNALSQRLDELCAGLESRAKEWIVIGRRGRADATSEDHGVR